MGLEVRLGGQHGIQCRSLGGEKTRSFGSATSQACYTLRSSLCLALLDGDGVPSYNRKMSEALAAEQIRLPSDEAERARIVAKIERSLASLDEGHGVPHAEVLAMIEARYPGSKQ